MVFGLENAVDLLTSIIVLWRFFGPGDGVDEGSKHRVAELQRRETRASLAISFLLFLLGVGVIATATHDLIQGQPRDSLPELALVLSLAFTSIVVFGTLCVIKFHYAHALTSEALYQDGICSTIGCVLAGAMLVNTLIVDRNPGVWYLDPVVALVCGLVALVLGCHAIVVARWRNRLPIFTIGWWIVSQGDGGMDGIRVREWPPAYVGDELELGTISIKMDAPINDDPAGTTLSELV